MEKCLLLLPGIFITLLQKRIAQNPLPYYLLNGNVNDSIYSFTEPVNGFSPIADRFCNANSIKGFDGVNYDYKFFTWFLNTIILSSFLRK